MDNSKNIYQRLGLRRVINAAGKLTVLGGSALSPEVAEAMAEAGQDFVSIAELMRLAGQRLAAATGAEAGFITSCAAAGIAIASAACITRGDLARVESLPHPPGPPACMIIQRGHSVHFGASIHQMMAMAGAEVVEIGHANRTLPYQLAAALDKNTAGVMFVVSHHTAPAGMLSLETVIDLAHAQDTPVVVDAAAELDLRKYIAAGADLVIYSGQKGIEGPASGLIAGRTKWIDACAQQNSGIGRAMKIGKEAIAGAIVALEAYTQRDPSVELERQAAAAQKMAGALAGIPGLAADVSLDPGRPIPRLRISIDPATARLSAPELVKRLESQEPEIRTRNHAVEHGVIEIDFRSLGEAEAQEIVGAIRKQEGAEGAIIDKEIKQ